MRGLNLAWSSCGKAVVDQNHRFFVAAFVDINALPHLFDTSLAAHLNSDVVVKRAGTLDDREGFAGWCCGRSPFILPDETVIHIRDGGTRRLRLTNAGTVFYCWGWDELACRYFEALVPWQFVYKHGHLASEE